MYNGSNRPITTTEFIVNELRQDILNGNIKSGQRLRQHEISEKFRVSPTPVREALKILTAEGLIDFDSYKGAIVKGLCYKDAKDIYDLRNLLEPKLIADGFENYDEKYLQEAVEIQDKIELCADLNEWAILNGEFHKCFWKSEVGSRTFNIVETLKAAAIPYVSLSLMYKKEHIELSNKEHRQIIKAYEQKDLQNLIRLSVEHTNKTKDILQEAINNSSI
ncbi:MAG: GntR family transcriptional regulator [Campylobacter sp.]|nr:GntR family transcriptional regulator [Campylobacter sp.]